MKKTIYAILPFLLIAGVFLAGSWYGQQGAVKAATPDARQILYYVDPMHPAYKSDKPGIAPDCGMELVPVYSDGTMGGAESSPAEAPGTVTINPERQQLIGVQARPVAKAAVTQSLRLLGRVAPDEARVYRVNAGIEGFIREVAPVTTGDHVTKDQLLATFSAPNAYNVIQLYILNLGAVDRIVQSTAAGSVDAQAAPAGAANLQLRVDQMEQLGVSPRQMEEIRRTRQIPQSIQILSPADGIVLARNVSPGLKFDKGAEWYRIADLRRVWILVDVFENEAQYLQPGKIVTVSLPQQNKTFQAKVSPVRPQFDPATRTLKVRLEADNPGDILRPDMFVDVELPVSTIPMIAVPVDAVVDSGLTQTVFVDRGEGRFEPRRVETGAHFGDRVEIVKGLIEGERIVVSGTFLLDSESRMKLTAQGATGPMHLGHTHPAESQTVAASIPGSSAHMHALQMAPPAMEAASEGTSAPTGHDHAAHDHMGHQP
ncbi:MAG TPA: efflux RND transporter periplasmic adaptor subunit [Candidatus Methylomirabilis sp.]|nr:efflux RND transporter periplasmic adaptor subunit [Candidatus Methylomirabilis sp.]